MDAAVLHEWGTPRFSRFSQPAPADGQVVVEVEAAGVNPVDLLIATGEFYIKPELLPYVVGTDGVGRLADGRRVYFSATVAPFGAAAQRTLVPAEAVIDLPEGVDPLVGAALGNSGLAAWLSLGWRARLAAGETVLVLGATGTVGRIAVQAAKLQGAARVVAVGRSADGLERAGELGADATVRLVGDGNLPLAELQTACGGGVDVIVDLLWGPPLATALEAAAVGARVVQIGTMAAPESRVRAATVRNRAIDILGYANYHADRELRAAAYREVAELARDKRLLVDVMPMPLAKVADAWNRQRTGAGRKLVLVP